MKVQEKNLKNILFLSLKGNYATRSLRYPLRDIPFPPVFVTFFYNKLLFLFILYKNQKST